MSDAAPAPEGDDREVIIPEGHERGEVLTLPQRAFYRFLWYVMQAVARGYFGLRTEGFEHVPATGAYIVSPIHRSNLDTPLVGAITRRRLRYMGKESMWKKKFGAWFLTAAGGFPVERGTADRAAIRACVEVLERGEPLVVFPEGTRQTGPDIHPFFDGPAYLACRAQVPILPIGIGGTEKAMPKGRKFPKRTRLTLVVGPPVHPPAPEPGKGRVPRRAIHELTEQLGVEIQRLFDEAQELAGDPNR
jgi:1-acyl-sn-glycerol-3-phosphate acyltransferase